MPYIKSISDSLDLIQEMTGLVSDTRKVFFRTVNNAESVDFFFDVRAPAVHLYTKKKTGEVVLLRAIPHNQLKSYLRGFFSFGRITQDKTNSTNEKETIMATTKKTTTKKTTAKKTTAKKTTAKKTTAKKGVSYGLGKKQDKKAIDAALKSLNGEMPFSTSARFLILKNFDNEACITVLEKNFGYEVTPSDINKVRRALRRKGEWQ